MLRAGACYGGAARRNTVLGANSKSYALVVQIADQNGAVRKVTILMLEAGRGSLTLLKNATGRETSAVEGERVDFSSRVERNPLFRESPVEVAADYSDVIGLRIVAQRRLQALEP